MENENIIDNVSEQTETPEPAPQKLGRSLASKNKPETTDVTPAAESESGSEAPKPKTTRTRKTAKTITEAEELESGSEAPKPKTTRTRKTAKTITEAEESESVTEAPKPKTTRTRKTAKTMTEAEELESESEVEAPKPKTTRTRKTAKTVTEAEELESGSEAPKPKTTRTRKTAKTITEAEELESGSEAPKPKITRTRKTAKTITEAEESELESESEAPKPKTTRTRKTVKTITEAEESEPEPESEPEQAQDSNQDQTQEQAYFQKPQKKFFKQNPGNRKFFKKPSEPVPEKPRKPYKPPKYFRTRVVADKDYDRLDTFIAGKYNLSRTYAQKLIEDRYVKYRFDLDKELKPSTKVAINDYFNVRLPEADKLEIINEVKPEPIDFETVYVDKFILVVNKPAGIVAHPAPDHWSGTLVNGVLYRYPDMAQMRDLVRPGVVHRLDASTSGLMVMARTNDILRSLKKVFKDRKVKKQYLALVHGTPRKSEGVLSGPIDRDPNNFLKRAVVEGGRPSITGYKVLWSMEGFSLLQCDLFTGRTHQIRTHLSAFGHPIVGDVLYGSDITDTRAMLHSWKLEFNHPAMKRRMRFRVPIPEDFRNFIHDRIMYVD